VDDVEGNLGASVAILQWPRDAGRRADLAGLGIPRLLVVAPGEPVPELADDEDWIREPAAERDIAARIAALRLRAGSVRLDDTSLHTPRGTVPLSPSEVTVAAVLLAAGTLVPRSALHAALPGPAAARAGRRSGRRRHRLPAPPPPTTGRRGRVRHPRPGVPPGPPPRLAHRRRHRPGLTLTPNPKLRRPQLEPAPERGPGSVPFRGQVRREPTRRSVPGAVTG